MLLGFSTVGAFRSGTTGAAFTLRTGALSRLTRTDAGTCEGSTQEEGEGTQTKSQPLVPDGWTNTPKNLNMECLKLEHVRCTNSEACGGCSVPRSLHLRFS